MSDDDRVPIPGSTLKRRLSVVRAFNDRARESGAKSLRRARARAAFATTEPDYDYEAFCQGIARLDGPGCFIHRLLREREESGADFELGLLLCEGVIDGHHLIRKNRLKQEFPNGKLVLHLGPAFRVTLARILEDPRNGVLACRRHHDLVEGGAVIVGPDDLPPRARAFAADFGIDGWLDRYYGMAS